ncbi:hypothetical protein C8Q74DRAFT_191976 [Fomes fomentarius]|nr:hypothetical protein C8Q74DRAFT_191976 [Fomes fomentarius]
MSLHRFLMNIDVIHAVFHHLDLFPHPITEFKHLVGVTDEAVVARRTLASAALTCRAFSEPASKTLWTCLHQGLSPLLKTFSCFKQTDASDDQDPSYELDDAISATEWEQFDRLASRVRYLDLGHPPSWPSLVDALIKRCQTKGEALLPNLRVLRWSESAGDTHKLQLLRALCSAPSLSLVSIMHDPRQHEFNTNVAQDLAVITETRPDLAHFSSIDYLYLRPNIPILSLRSLRSLQVGPADEASFCQIGTFTYLTDLSTTVLGMHAVRPRLNKAFPALRRLKTSGAPATLIWMIAQISSPNLTSITADIDAKDIADILPIALPVGQSLEQLHLDILGTYGSGERIEVAFADLAHSILSLRGLEDVRLRLVLRALSLSDADIALIKSAWPRLRRLSLSELFFDQSQPDFGLRPSLPSLPALVDLALARPQLETLDVEVASVTEDELVRLESISTGAPELEHPTTALKWLTFARSGYRSRIAFPTDIPRLARALHRLFPLVGGLGRPIKDAKGGGITTYYLWSELDVRHDVFRLLDHLDKLNSRPYYHTHSELGVVNC